MPAWVSIGNTHARGSGESNLTSPADPPTHPRLSGRSRLRISPGQRCPNRNGTSYSSSRSLCVHRFWRGEWSQVSMSGGASWAARAW
jgi:hypothetical protein